MHISWMLLANFYNALTMCSNLGHVLVLYPYNSYRRLTHTQANSFWRQKGSAKSDLKTQSCSTSTQYVKMDGFFSLIPVLFWKTITLIHHVWMDHVWSVCNLVSSFWLFSNSQWFTEAKYDVGTWSQNGALWEFWVLVRKHSKKASRVLWLQFL